MVISVHDCLHLQEKARCADQIVVDQLSERIDDSVKRAILQGMDKVDITVPTFMWGLPEFDRLPVKQALMDIYRRSGLQVEQHAADIYTFSLTWPKTAGKEGA